jgi:hypothetical protein
MTGRELKVTILQYLKSRGWRQLKLNEFYAWAPPGYDPKNPDDVENVPHHYCWHAALLVQIAADENAMIRLPAGAFEVVKGGQAERRST